jgi:hypothetical protein
MAMPLYEFEMEALPELEAEFEYEAEWEGEFETEQFFRRLGQWVQTQWGTQGSPLRRVALGAARAALTGGGGALGSVLAGGPGVGTAIGATLGGAAGGVLPQPESEAELEYEMELEARPVGPIQAQALMEHLGHAATQSESEAEAEAFIGAMIPLAARLIPRVAPAIMRAAPGLIRGVTGVVRTLRRNPATRPLVRAVPTIIRRTAGTIAQNIAQGQPVTPRTAVRALAQQTARVLNNPQQCVNAYQRSRALDRRFHASAGARSPAGR